MISIRRILSLALMALFLLPVGVRAQGEGDDDFGLWYEVGVEKNLPKRFSLGLDGEVRTQNNAASMDRMNLGIDVGYKLNKYVKFSLGYVVMGYYNPEEKKTHYKKDGVTTNGYNLDKSYWNLRHRVNVEVTGTFKPCNWLRLSLRERYQFTHANQSTYTREKWRDVTDAQTGEKTTQLSETEERIDTVGDYHTLRSRFKVEFDKKRCKWKPYVSVELHNFIQNNFRVGKVRTCIGCDYKINKHHTVGLGYVLTHKFESDEPTTRMHAVAINYNFDF